MDPLNESDLEIFVITNGRKTLEYVMESIKLQTVQRKITVIKNMKWADALNRCVKLCESSYFLRVDDDMMLHKYAVAYYLSRIHVMVRKKGGVYLCRLWEDWSNKPVNGLRMYRTRVARKLRFRASRLGKVDKVYRTRMQSLGYRQIKDRSMVGIHALASMDDQEKYRALWRDKNATISARQFTKTFDNKIHPVRKSISRQYKLLGKMRKLNSVYKGKYLKFIYDQRQKELENG